MPKEQGAQMLYSELTKDIEKAMGSDDITTTSQLNQIGGSLFGEKFLGAYPRDDIPLDRLKPGDMVIINTDTSDQPGQHWMPFARGLKKRSAYYYHDPFAKFHLKMEQKGFGTGRALIEADSTDQEQSTKENNCGQRALAWLLVFQHCGEDAATKI